MKKILNNIISAVQQTIMKRYGTLTEVGYIIEKDIPPPVAHLIRTLGKWLVALSSGSNKRFTLIFLSVISLDVIKSL